MSSVPGIPIEFDLNKSGIDEVKIISEDVDIITIDEKTSTIDIKNSNYSIKDNSILYFSPRSNNTKYTIDIISIRDNKEIKKDKISVIEKNYEYIQQIIRQQNCLLTKTEQEEYKPANEHAKRIIEKLKKSKEQIKKIKQKENEAESLTLFDLISILAAHGNGINAFNVWDLNMFAFNNQFNRMKMFEEYNVNIQALIHGADSNKIEYTHWMSKIKTFE
jgi:hypothetical protein